MELTGKIFQVLQIQTGQGKNGPWQKQEFVIETADQFSKKVCFSLWGEKINDLKNLEKGTMVKVQFSLESREYNGRWYTDARAYRIEPAGTQPESPENAPPPFMEPADLSPKEDDLPF